MKGVYEHNIDAKGRLFIPTKLREGLGDNFVVTRGLDGCLSLYSESSWKVMEEKISSLPLSQSRDLQRYFFSSAMDCEPDTQGRVVIPQNLREFAGIKKTVVVVGMINRAEVWDADKWNSYSGNISEDKIIATMEGLGI